MVDWKKRVSNFSENGLNNGEDVIASAFLQPVGALTEATGRASFGLVGMFASRKMTASKKKDNQDKASKMSSEFPDGNVIVAITSTGRILTYEQAPMSGKPKRLLKEFKKGDFRVESIKKGMLKSDLTLAFNDGGLRDFELAKGQNTDEFENALI